MADQERVIVVQCPAAFTPEFCNQARVELAKDISAVGASVEKIEKRFYHIVILGVVQLLSVVGALAYFLLTRVELHQAAAALIE